MDDICVVYDTTRSSLNETVWVPWFLMPAATSIFRSMKVGTYMGDCDMGEMF